MWLPDGNEQYFRGKHIALIVVAFLIGVPYTFFLFFWQWLIQMPNTRLFTWTKNTRLNAIITTYHAPYNYKHHYWTGLLLVVRVVLYITVAVTGSHYPELPLLMTVILVGCLLFIKGISGIRLYKKTSVDNLEMASLLNLLTFAAFSLYHFKADYTKQIAIAYVSTIITLIIFIGCIVGHAYFLLKKKRTVLEEDLIPLINPLPNLPQTEVTYSIMEIPRADSESSSDESNYDQLREVSNLRNETAPACECHDYDKVDPIGNSDSYPLPEKCHKTM